MKGCGRGGAQWREMVRGADEGPMRGCGEGWWEGDAKREHREGTWEAEPVR